jgi:hypothetical protein
LRAALLKFPCQRHEKKPTDQDELMIDTIYISIFVSGWVGAVGRVVATGLRHRRMGVSSIPAPARGLFICILYFLSLLLAPPVWGWQTSPLLSTGGGQLTSQYAGAIGMKWAGVVHKKKKKYYIIINNE